MAPLPVGQGSKEPARGGVLGVSSATSFFLEFPLIAFVASQFTQPARGTWGPWSFARSVATYGHQGMLYPTIRETKNPKPERVFSERSEETLSCPPQALKFLR